jgi:hypothetical protein
MTLDDLENDEVFSAAVKGLPKVVELIAAIPEEKPFTCIGGCAAKLSADCASGWL